MQQRIHLFGLVDGAASPARIQPLLEQSGAQLTSLYAGLPEEQLGPASLFLVRIENTEASWVAELDQIDLHAPCVMLIWSHLDLHELAVHLHAFLFTGIGEGMTAMIRFFDPRNIDAILDMWGESIRKVFLAPLVRLKYRGRHEQWQTIENDSLEAG
jgi:hypothetical protein